MYIGVGQFWFIRHSGHRCMMKGRGLVGGGLRDSRGKQHKGNSQRGREGSYG